MAIKRSILALACIGMAVSITIMTSGCAYSKKEVIQVPCIIPDTVTYAVNIEPVVRRNCYGCHSTGADFAGFTFDTYASLKLYAQSGRLYGAISHASGYRPMPDGGDKLDNCTITLIKKWIDAGTPEK